MRVTVVSGGRRADLAVPGDVPVAELLPDLARCVGLLDAHTAHGGFTMVTPAGRRLVADTGLRGQGLEDGVVVTVVAAVDDVPPTRYDDAVEVMAEVRSREVAPWDAVTGRRTALGAGLLLLLSGAAALVTQHGSAGAAVAASAIGLGSVVAAVTLARARGDAVVAVSLAWMGCGYAAVAALALTWDAASGGTPVAAGGAAVLVAGLAATLGLPAPRLAMLPPVVLGTVLLGAGLVARVLAVGVAEVLTCVLVAVVLAGRTLPGIALALTGPPEDPVGRRRAGADEPAVGVDRVAAHARTAHRVLVAVSVAVGLLLLVTTPAAVSLGPAGALVAVLASVVTMLRTRPYLARAEVLVGLGSGALGMVASVLPALWWHPTWRPTAAGVLPAVGTLLLVLGLTPRHPAVRVGRLADLVEGLAVVTLPPALVLAVGVVGAVAR